MKEKPDPRHDGVTHINVYSQGKTLLGQLLSNFAHTPFKHPTHGHFASVEGYWYWCASGRSQQHLRRLYGLSAKSAGVKCEPIPMDDTEFQEMICEGIRCKIEQNDALRELFVASTLPFIHYYVYGHGANAVVVYKDKHSWQMEYLEALRKEMQGAQAPSTPPAETETKKDAVPRADPPTFDHLTDAALEHQIHKLVVNERLTLSSPETTHDQSSHTDRAPSQQPDGTADPLRG